MPNRSQSIGAWVKSTTAPWFAIRGELPPATRAKIFAFGAVVLFFTWWAAVRFAWINPLLYPSPIAVFKSILPLFTEDAFLKNFAFSLKINILAYAEALLIALPLGFLIGLFGFFDALIGPWLKLARYLPLTLLLVIFMSVFGLYTNMKVQFLTATIVVYLIPAIAARIRGVPEVQVQKLRTLGGNPWQIIKYVFLPQGVGYSWDEITNLVAISWTYIIFIEMVNKTQGGIGKLAYDIYYRGGETEKLYGILILMLIAGYLMDRVMRMIDVIVFSFKFRGGN